MKRTNNQGFIFKNNSKKIKRIKLKDTKVEGNKIESIIRQEEQVENNQGYLFDREIEELEAEGAIVEKNIIIETVAEETIKKVCLACKAEVKECFCEKGNTSLCEYCCGDNLDKQNCICTEKQINSKTAELQVKSEQQKKAKETFIKEEKQTEFKELTISKQSELKSSDILSNKNYRKDNPLKEIIKGLKNIKLRPSKKAAKEGVKILYQIHESEEMEEKVAQNWKHKEENKSLEKQLVASQTENQNLLNPYNNLWEGVVNRQEVNQEAKVIQQQPFGIPGSSKK